MWVDSSRGLNQDGSTSVDEIDQTFGRNVVTCVWKAPQAASDVTDEV